MHDIDALKKSFFSEIGSILDAKSLEALRVKYVGREHGVVTGILRSLKNLPPEEKRIVGPRANAFRDEIETALNGKLRELQAASAEEMHIDLTRPGVKIEHGHLHPLTLIQERMNHVFRGMNFSVVEGPEIETEYYNFDALNIPKNHPARDMWDTFWLKRTSPKGDRLLLRTHTSPMQIRYMETHKPPFQIIVPGRVFRYEATDATHETNFQQCEGLMVGKNVNLRHFKYVIETFFKKVFGEHIEFRYRPTYFPFVEPGLEIDVKLPGGKWLEVMGAGMVHPNVFEAAGYPKGEWQGFAFGMGVERLAMIKYKIPDVRLFHSGDLRFIEQF